MSSTSESSSPTTYQRQSNEDYASYVSRITKMKSMSEGTHSPALQDRPGPTQHTFVGRFGTVVYLQRFDQTTPAAQRTTTTASAAPPAAQRTTTTASAAPPAAQRTTTTAPPAPPAALPPLPAVLPPLPAAAATTTTVV